MEILHNFGIEPTLLLAQIVNFLIILFLLKKFFFGPIVKVLEERKNKIAESLKNADLIEEKLQKTEADSAAILEKAKSEAQTLLTDAKTESQRITDNASIEAKKTIEDAQIAIRTQIAAEKEKLQKEVQSETMSLVSDVVKKVLGRTMSKNEKAEMTKVAVSQMSKQM